MQAIMTDSNSINQGWRSRLANRMAELSLSQTRLAEVMNVSQGTVNHWLSGRREPGLETLAKLATALKMSSAELITGIDRAKEQLIDKVTPEELKMMYATLRYKQELENKGISGGVT